ncbi:MAG: multiheme c-type cytochrome [Desulfatiglandales bacterium]
MKRLFPLFILLLIPFWGYRAMAYTQEDCVQCHGEKGGMSQFRISFEEFQGSVHGRDLICLDCHRGVKDKGHEEKRGSGVVACGDCHDQENRHGLQSKQGNRPECHACHTRHGILPKDDTSSSIHFSRLVVTCRNCHAAECGDAGLLARLPSIRIASHKKQDFYRSYERTNCIGCHQGAAVHGEDEPVDDQACNTCHTPVGGRPGLWGTMHPKADLKTQPGTFAAAVISPVIIMALLGGAVGFGLKRRIKRRGE